MTFVIFRLIVFYALKSDLSITFLIFRNNSKSTIFDCLRFKKITNLGPIALNKKSKIQQLYQSDFAFLGYYSAHVISAGLHHVVSNKKVYFAVRPMMFSRGMALA